MQHIAWLRPRLSVHPSPRVIALALLLVVLFGAGLLVLRRGAPPSGAPLTAEPVAAVSVGSMVVRPAPMSRGIDLTGTVRPSLTADMAPKVMGRVAAVEVREADRVKAGQVLVRLEAADLSAQARRAEAAVAAARAALAQAQTALGIQHTQSSTRVEQAKAAARAGARPPALQGLA